MRAAFLLIAVLLAAGVFLLWVARHAPPVPVTAFRVPTTTLVASPPPGSDDGPVVLTGVVIYDLAGEPPVPYLEYPWGDGVRTKQLIFRDGQGCAPEAGDTPCFLPSNDAPRPAYGARIRASGTILGDQLLVDAIERL